MTYGIEGPQRSGKSKMAAVLGITFSELMNIPLFSTNQIKGSDKILFYDDILKLKNCVFVWDEIDKDLQARRFKKNMEDKDKIMHWFTQCGKLDIILIWTTQFDRQVDIICKENTNTFIITRKNGNASTYTFYNQDIGKIYKKIGPIDLSAYNNLYDHKEYMEELQWRQKEKKKNFEKHKPKLMLKFD